MTAYSATTRMAATALLVYVRRNPDRTASEIRHALHLATDRFEAAKQLIRREMGAVLIYSRREDAYRLARDADDAITYYRERLKSVRSQMVTVIDTMVSGAATFPTLQTTFEAVRQAAVDAHNDVTVLIDALDPVLA